MTMIDWSISFAEAMKGELKILLIEDDDDTRDIMVRLIRRLGCEVRAASTAADGIAILDRWRPTHILLDLMMPDRPGSDVLRHVRQCNLPMRVAVVTGAGPGSEALADARKAGPDAVFPKPVQFDEIESWLNAPTAERARNH